MDVNEMNIEGLQVLIVTYGVKTIGVIVVLVVGWIIAGMLGSLVGRACDRAKLDLTLSRFFSKLTRYTVLVMVLLACLGAFGIQTTSFAAVIGAAVLAVGLSLQGSLSNFSAGVMLLIFRPFKIGDVVSTAGHTGKVFEIALFTTSLDTPDNRRIILPNGSVFGADIENVTFHATRRVDVEVGVDYSADIDKTRSILEGIPKSVENVLDDPAPAIVLTGLGGSSVDWVVRMWANTGDYWAVKEAGLRAVKIALDEAGIGIPFPQMDVHLDGKLHS